MTYRNFLYCGRYKLYFLHIESFLPFISCIFYLASLFLCLSITPHAGSDHTRQQFMSLIGRFQYTLPLRGVTVTQVIKEMPGLFQSTLLMQGVTNEDGSTYQIPIFQYILPIRGVTIPFRSGPVNIEFQSALPLRGVTASVSDR